MSKLISSIRFECLIVFNKLLPFFCANSNIFGHLFHFVYKKTFWSFLCYLPIKMQENNNFETIIQKWRRLSTVEQVEQKESVAIASMSGDSSNQQTLLKKKEEDSELFGTGRSENVPVAVTGTGVVASSELSPDIISINPEDKNENQEFIKHNKEDSKEAAGDTKDIGGKDDFESRKDEKTLDTKTAKGALEDNVDSVFLRSQPPYKARSTASTVEEEDCGIKCLYYTLQCCDCVLM